MKKKYIGDDVYAMSDELGILLTVEDEKQLEVKQSIYLEKHVLLRFERYIKDSEIFECDQIKILTRYINPPVSYRHMDWIAWVDGKEHGAHGWGKTEQEAIEYLKENLNENI